MGPWGDKCCRNVVTYDGVVVLCLSIADRIRRSVGVVTLWKFYEQLRCISKWIVCFEGDYQNTATSTTYCHTSATKSTCYHCHTCHDIHTYPGRSGRAPCWVWCWEGRHGSAELLQDGWSGSSYCGPGISYTLYGKHTHHYYIIIIVLKNPIAHTPWWEYSMFISLMLLPMKHTVYTSGRKTDKQTNHTTFTWR